MPITVICPSLIRSPRRRGQGSIAEPSDRAPWRSCRRCRISRSSHLRRLETLHGELRRDHAHADRHAGHNGPDVPIRSAGQDAAGSARAGAALRRAARSPYSTTFIPPSSCGSSSMRSIGEDAPLAKNLFAAEASRLKHQHGASPCDRATLRREKTAWP
jgi:hypothetical protein